MEIIEKNSVEELLDFLRLSHSRWQIAQVTTSSNTWVFRGQGDSRWSLTPKAHRLKPDQCGGEFPAPWGALAREFDHLTGFLELADEIGILPHHRQTFPGFYAAIQKASADESAPPPDYTPELLEALSLAQHHGISTRLLDWSASPLTAAFFAARAALDGAPDLASFAIWAMPRQRPGDNRIRLITPSRTLNRFAHRQTGYLSLDLLAEKHFSSTNGWQSQDEVLEEYQRTWGGGRWPCLRKIVVPRNCAADLLIALYQEGVSLVHLMPTLDNIVETMRLRSTLEPVRLGMNRGHGLQVDRGHGLHI